LWLLQFHSCTCAPFQCSSRAGSAAPGAGPAAGEESWLLRCAVELERWKNRELAACRVQCAHLDHLFLSNFVSCREKIPYQWHFLKTQRLAQRIQYNQAAVHPAISARLHRGPAAARRDVALDTSGRLVGRPTATPVTAPATTSAMGWDRRRGQERAGAGPGSHAHPRPKTAR